MDRPRFEQLPTSANGLRHAWDFYGRDDELGSVNLLTPARVLSAVAAIREGRIFSLDVPLAEIDPAPIARRLSLRHVVYAPRQNVWDDRLEAFEMQSSSHWDGLRHFGAGAAGYYGGFVGDFEPGPGRLGLEHWVRHGIAGRGVLLDVERHLRLDGVKYDPYDRYPIAATTLAATAARQGVELREGDVVLVRLGWMAGYLSADRARREAITADRIWAGLEADEAMAAWLWDHGIAALACDNPAIEVSPGDPAVGSLHRRLLPSLGMLLGELFQLEELARACATDGRWEFFFTSVPLHLPGGVGSPANAIAIR